MIRRLGEIDVATLSGFDTIIDVRSPSEFAEDHLPGAVNLPVLDDAERAEVGTEYVQGSKFRARRNGAALVARNIARHLEGALADAPSGLKALVYCWRGGQRSHAMATIMDQVGWPVTVVEGGYQTWRRSVVSRLYEGELGLKVVRLEGATGVGKSAMLARLAGAGVQTIDLEGLANHRGSLFGRMPGGQPSQKLFDSRLMAAVSGLDPERPVVVEAESSRIGRVTLPPALWRVMSCSPTVVLERPLEDRVDRILADYADTAAEPEAIAALVARMPRHHSKARKVEWLGMVAQGHLADFVRALIVEHYDPAYAGSRRGGSYAPRVPADDLDAVLWAVERR